MNINAPIERVWQVMTDTRNYAAWNPFVVSIHTDGDATQPGTAMKFTVQWKNGSKASSNEQVTEAMPPYADTDGIKHAHWAYVFTGPLDKLGMVHAIRHQWLTQNADGTTTYKTQEVFTGWLISFLPLAKVQDGFERQAKALADYTEKQITS